MPKTQHDYKEKNFLEYLGAEQTNLHVSMHNLHTEFNIFTHIDWLYHGIIRRAKVPEDEMLVMQLFLFCHYHLYHTGATLLRCHLGDAMASARKAIDASLIARRIADDPNSQQQYIDGHGSFKMITKHFRTELYKGRYNSEKWYLDALLSLHNNFSRGGSHADLAGFAHRLEWDRNDGSEAMLHYFQKPPTISEFALYFLALSKTFLLILNLFEDYFVDQKQFVAGPWKHEIRRIGTVIEKRMAELKNDNQDEPPY